MALSLPCWTPARRRINNVTAWRTMRVESGLASFCHPVPCRLGVLFIRQIVSLVLRSQWGIYPAPVRGRVVRFHRVRFWLCRSCAAVDLADKGCDVMRARASAVQEDKPACAVSAVQPSTCFRPPSRPSLAHLTRTTDSALPAQQRPLATMWNNYPGQQGGYRGPPGPPPPPQGGPP